MGLTDQRRGEGLQLAQFPFGGGVDQLHGARDFDVDLDPRLVHQFESAARTGHAAGKAVLRVVERLLHSDVHGLHERVLEGRAMNLQGLRDGRLLAAFARGERAVLGVAQQPQRTGDRAFDERRRARQLIVDELLQHGSDRHEDTPQRRNAQIIPPSIATASAASGKRQDRRRNEKGPPMVAPLEASGCPIGNRQCLPFKLPCGAAQAAPAWLTCPYRPCHPCHPYRRACRHRRRTRPSALPRSCTRL